MLGKLLLIIPVLNHPTTNFGYCSLSQSYLFSVLSAIIMQIDTNPNNLNCIASARVPFTTVLFISIDFSGTSSYSSPAAALWSAVG